MEAKPSVSIIIPIYNVEKDLVKCLESVSRQSLQDIEVILINDGSTDSSYQIAGNYVKKDSRFSLYSQKNIGLGETRNRGIDLAKGNYLAFVDSDDFLDDDYIEKLYKKATETDADVVQGEVLEFWDDGRSTELEQDLSKISGICLNRDNVNDFYRDDFFTHTFRHYAWNKIYKSAFVKEHHLKFGDNKKIFAEDTWFQLQLLHYFPHIEYVPGSQYHYRQRNTSIMHQPKKNLMKRQSLMVADYWKLIRNGENFGLEKKVCEMIAMDVFTMEALNQMRTGGSARSLHDHLKDIGRYPVMYNCVTNFNKDKAFDLEKNKNRGMYLRGVSILYKLHLERCAADFIWFIYKKIR